MSELKLSPWHDGSVKPVHIGIYQRFIFNSPDWCFFDGEFWYFFGIDKKDAYMEYLRGHKSDIEGMWRGILK